MNRPEVKHVSDRFKRRAAFVKQKRVSKVGGRQAVAIVAADNDLKGVDARFIDKAAIAEGCAFVLGEYDAEPTLSFRMRLPRPGEYDLWVHVDADGDRYVRIPVTVTP